MASLPSLLPVLPPSLSIVADKEYAAAVNRYVGSLGVDDCGDVCGVR